MKNKTSETRYYPPKQREKAAARLERIRIATQRASDTELTISTSPVFYLFRPRIKGGVMVEYPRSTYDTRLAIHHGGGDIWVSNVTGAIEATSSRGDILLMLPEKGKYSIDARSNGRYTRPAVPGG
jgi:hypothetical protein